MFSKEGPSEEKQESTTFTIFLYGKGWSKKFDNAAQDIDEPMDKEVVAKVSGKNPGYGSTCLALTLTAIMIFTEQDKMPKAYVL